MTPEEDITKLVAAVCPQSGHWPYTRDAELYIGFRPSDDGPISYAAGRAVRVSVVYDLVICAARHRLADYERMRYALYDALRRGGWTLDATPGPESYNRATQLYQWPLSARKDFVIRGVMPTTIGGCP